ncbi:hypothetical protein ELH76_19525 [Rhizobium ruizarguesonis]|nr:hypothetical protein ELH76_19525 [Rhizobium ruizarguesonis]
MTDELSTGRPSTVAKAITLKRIVTLSPWHPMSGSETNEVMSVLRVYGIDLTSPPRWKQLLSDPSKRSLNDAAVAKQP